MVSIILASHGNFATGILQSSQMIFGEQDNLEAVTFQPDEGPDDLRQHLLEAVDAVGGFDDDILFLVDLWGGSPFNQANAIYEEHTEHAAIVTGLNLPMLLEALGQRSAVDSAHDLAAALVTPATDGIKTRPEMERPTETADDTASENANADKMKGGRLPKGTALGDGKIKYVLARIDTRLLHGQVATGWAKSTNPNRIIVVSDSVAHDKMRKTLIGQAAPAGMSANVIPVSKLAEIDQDPRFGATRALLLFETPQDVLAALKAGVKLRDVNVGSMAHSKGKMALTNAVSVDEQDIQDFKTMMNDYGVHFFVQKVPNDKARELTAVLKEHNH